MNKDHIAIVIPVYGCAKALPELSARLVVAVENITQNYGIYYVNDASPDEAWDVISQIASKNPRIQGISLSRNFGQHNAIAAGLDQSDGDWTVVMDCDLQDTPEEILRLYNKARDGYDIVVGRRSNRQDSPKKRILSRLFYVVFSYLTNEKLDHRVGNFGIYSRKVIQAIRKMPERNRAFGLLALWVGFNRTEIEIEHSRRCHGRSSYTFGRLIRFAMDIIIAHSDKLLKIVVKFGFAVALFSLLAAGWLAFGSLFLEKKVAGWTSLIVAITTSTGLIIGTIGVVGLYIGKIFDEIKHRPLYIIDKATPPLHDEQ